jgi:hypothetical protein
VSSISDAFNKVVVDKDGFWPFYSSLVTLTLKERETL